MHTVTCKLNKAARQHQNSAGMTFFVSLGEQNYNHKTKAKEWTNYEAALFAKDGQIQYYNDVLLEGAIITVSGTGIIVQLDEAGQYPPKLVLCDSKLEFAMAGSQPQRPAPQQQQAPQQHYQQPQQQAPQQYQQAPQQQAPDDDIPF